MTDFSYFLRLFALPPAPENSFLTVIDAMESSLKRLIFFPREGLLVPRRRMAITGDVDLCPVCPRGTSFDLES